MSRSQVRISVEGLNRVVRGLDATQFVQEVDEVTEAQTLLMANESAERAPVKTGKLRNSIVASPEKIAPALWEYGSDVDYAKIQEYTHKTQSGFIRDVVWSNERVYRGKILRLVRGLGR
ncbi:HK97 gp10 family phage protein [Bacillus subtilis]|uniref:HK97 gp10 family phage protein n=1 Tax=Bacillus subtilis TaxID=1423 RepID=UPI000695E8C8|nr:HK97 gp10 family phage protein [Bacillus subtilis]WNA14180.1 tail protein [Bacillus phage phi18-2]MCR1994551.1 HK97 gp10 family phage protein [Bacillus subtilis]MDF4197298.1 HK97 gp10 family phage protein [Bacillus subtilis]MDF4219331.1 HK97 gp10 family phage protein [Bacillus subtilis]MDK1004010.1 HK97 gp10 family phage protein [Bacillus subtilis]